MFAERIKQLRKEKGLTQTELARALGISGATVAMWETGKRRPSFEMMEKLTDFFDKNLGYLIGDSDDDVSPTPTEEQVNLMGLWQVQEEYQDILRRYMLLDEYGQGAVDAIIRAEFVRCHEQGSLCRDSAFSVAVKIRNMDNARSGD